MSRQFSPQLKQVISRSREEAIRLNNNVIEPEHLLLAILQHTDSLAVKVLSSLDIKLADLKQTLETKIPQNLPQHAMPSVENLPLSKEAEKVLKVTFLEAKILSIEGVKTEHLLLSILNHKNNLASDILNQFDVDYEIYKAELEYVKTESATKPIIMSTEEPFEEETTSSRKSSKSRTPVLDNFGQDITQLAEEGKLDPFIGSDAYLYQISILLSRRRGSNPVLICPPGIYRRNIINGLANSIVEKKVIRRLYNVRIIELDQHSLVSGIKSNAQLVQRVVAIRNELEKSRNVILFIDDITSVLGVDRENDFHAGANVLKKAIEQDSIQVISSSSPEGFQSFLGQNAPLAKSFKKVIIDAPSVNDSFIILNNLKYKYEEFHNVLFSDESIQLCIDLSDLYIIDQNLPDKAIDILDEIGARVFLKNIHVPKHIEELEKRLEEIKERKNQAVKNQQYEKAADLRDDESKTARQLEFAKVEWDEETKTRRYPVIEEDVYEVFQKITGLSQEALSKREPLIKEKIEQEEFIEFEETDYYKKKVEEYDLENKASIKLENIPEHLSTSLQQYLLYFKEYTKKVKGKDIFFDVTKTDEGLRLNIKPDEVKDFDELNTWLNEYLDYISKKTEEFVVNFETEINDKEAEIVMAEIKNQIRYMESQLEILQLQMKNLPQDELFLKKISVNISKNQKQLIAQGYGDSSSFKHQMKENIGKGSIKKVLDELLKYSNTNEHKTTLQDEILIFNARLSELDLKFRTGIITYETERSEKQQIIKSILAFINDLD